MSTLRQQAANLPVLPGVYLFKNSTGAVLYVGKAIRLRERVRSYFATDIGRGPGIEQMVRESVTLDHEVVGSEMEALLLEARLIRQYKPKYNIKLRDDKSFSLIRIDMSQEFPGIYISREKELEELLFRKKRERAGVGRVSQKIDQQEFFGPYLSASSVKGALKAIRKIWPFRDCTDTKYSTYEKLGHGCIFATLNLCDAPCAAKVTREEYMKNIEQVRMFLRGDREKVIGIIRSQMEEAASSEKFEQATKLRNRLQNVIHLQEVAESRRFVENQRRSGFYHYDPTEDLRIECFDISNISGSHAVGSQIVGIVRRGKLEKVESMPDARRRFYLDKSRYKKFRIKTVEGISDTDMLKEVLGRRLKRGLTSAEQWALPDLIIVDGGKGQLSIVDKVRTELELSQTLNIGSVAKGPTRKKVDLYGDGFAAFPEISKEAWQTIAELLREEAHRFAISYYRSLHRRSLVGRKS